MYKICHITSAHRRYDVRIFLKESISLCNAGYDVTILCVDDMPDEIKNGVKILSINHVFKNRIDRILNSSKLLFKKAIEINADVYHLHDPELLGLGKRLKKKGKKVIFDSHEDQRLTMKKRLYIPRLLRPLIAKVYNVKESDAFKKFDGIICVTPYMLENIKKFNNNVCVITNFPIIDENATFNREIFDKKYRQICFAGNIDAKYNLTAIAQAIEETDIKFIIADKYDDNNSYIKELKKYKNVQLLGFIPKEQVIKLYQESMVGAAILFDDVLYSSGEYWGIVKIFEFMSFGVPVIVANNDFFNKIIKENNCGICVQHDNIDEIRNAIIKLVDNAEIRYEMGLNGMKVCGQKYNWKSQELKLLDFYDKILK